MLVPYPPFPILDTSHSASEIFLIKRALDSDYLFVISDFKLYVSLD